MHTRMHACAQWLGSVTRRTLGLKPPSIAQLHTRCAASASATVLCSRRNAVGQPAHKFASPTAPQLHSLLSRPITRGLARSRACRCARLPPRTPKCRDVPDSIPDVPALRPKPQRCNGSRKAGAGWRPGSRAHGRQSCARGKCCGWCLAAAGPRGACLFRIHWSQPALATDARIR